MGDFEGVIWLSRANEVEVKVEIKSRDTGRTCKKQFVMGLKGLQIYNIGY
jgi:hypothetical protein